MTERIKIDKDYLEAFNLGYELARELNLKSPMFPNINSGNTRMTALQAGSSVYFNEHKQVDKKERNLPRGLDGIRPTSEEKESVKTKGDNNNKGLDLSM